LAKYSLNSSEAIYQPGSSDCVLLNKLSIIDEAEMETLESGSLLMLYEKIFIESAPLTALNFGHIQQWNRHWLGNVYDWAGLLRSVNLVKEGFKFAAADGTPISWLALKSVICTQARAVVLRDTSGRVD